MARQTGFHLHHFPIPVNTGGLDCLLDGDAKIKYGAEHLGDCSPYPLAAAAAYDQ